jgi:hypothetical protein
MVDGEGEVAGVGRGGAYLGCERRKVNFVCDMFRYSRQGNWWALRLT